MCHWIGIILNTFPNGEGSTLIKSYFQALGEKTIGEKLKQVNFSSSYFLFIYSNVKSNVQCSIYMLITPLVTVFCNFIIIIIIIIYSVENEWIISKWGNTPYNGLGEAHITSVFLTLHRQAWSCVITHLSCLSLWLDLPSLKSDFQLNIQTIIIHLDYLVFFLF